MALERVNVLTRGCAAGLEEVLCLSDLRLDAHKLLEVADRDLGIDFGNAVAGIHPVAPGGDVMAPDLKDILHALAVALGDRLESAGEAVVRDMADQLVEALEPGMRADGQLRRNLRPRNVDGLRGRHEMAAHHQMTDDLRNLVGCESRLRDENVEFIRAAQVFAERSRRRDEILVGLDRAADGADGISEVTRAAGNEGSADAGENAEREAQRIHLGGALHHFRGPDDLLAEIFKPAQKIVADGLRECEAAFELGETADKALHRRNHHDSRADAEFTLAEQSLHERHETAETRVEGVDVVHGNRLERKEVLEGHVVAAVERADHVPELGVRPHGVGYDERALIELAVGKHRLGDLENVIGTADRVPHEASLLDRFRKHCDASLQRLEAVVAELFDGLLAEPLHQGLHEGIVEVERRVRLLPVAPLDRDQILVDGPCVDREVAVRHGFDVNVQGMDSLHGTASRIRFVAEA
ncbi:hypothetical protein D3C71_258770 [compost metagenome]